MKTPSKRARKEALRRRRQRQRLIWGVGGIGAFLLITAMVMALSSRPGDPSTVIDADSVALGQQVYAAQCAGCHGANLEGEPNWKQANPDGSLRAPPHDETGHTWHHDDAYLMNSIKLGGARLQANQGTSAMPAFENVLADDEITAVLAYIKSNWPPDIRAAQARR